MITSAECCVEMGGTRLFGGEVEGDVEVLQLGTRDGGEVHAVPHVRPRQQARGREVAHHWLREVSFQGLEKGKKRW